jgi:tetratricopeptide (TPR) repeat protein
MNTIDWLLLLIALGALGTLGVIAWRKAPQLSIVDPMSSKEARAREKKQALLEARMMRQVKEKGGAVVNNHLAPIFAAIRDWFRRLAGKLTALERRYVERQRAGGTIDATELHRMVDEAKAAVATERYDVAEKALIAVVSHDPKNIPAYEALGRMYMLQNQYIEAKEAFEFLARLAPKDASVLVSLGEVHDALHESKAAHTYYKKGKDLSPNNPKYLDFFIRSAIDVGEFYEAQKAIDHLKEVNPENQMIAEFEEMLGEARKK